MLHRHTLSLGLAALLLAGCSGGGTPSATPTVAVTTSETTNVTTTNTTPEAGTPTPEATATETAPSAETGTPTPGETQDPAYVKLKEEGMNLAFGKGYAEAETILKKALAMNPDDPEVHFYLMLSQGNLEETPTPKSEAYTHAKKVLELAPGSSMAERARDYVLSAESEPAKPLPNLDVPPILRTQAKFKTNALYTLPAKAAMLPTTTGELGEADQKQLWYLEVAPKSVPEKVELDKGTTFSVRKASSFAYSKLSWRGNVEKRLAAGEHDDNSFLIDAFYIEVESGPSKGKKGWLVNQMDRWLGVDDKDEAVWGTKLIRLPLDRG